MSAETALVEVSDGIGTVTLNRPDKLNAYTLEMGEAVTAAIRGLQADASVRAIILTGAGRGFCAGVDLDALKAHQSGDGPASGPKLGEEDFLRKLPLEIAQSDTPVIAAVNGHAIGVGVTMILPCDFRIAAEGAKLGLTFAKLGLLPGLGSSHLLPRLVGRARARELVLTARVIRAEEALAIGLVDRVVPGDELLDAARSLAAELAEIDPLVLAAGKEVLDFGAENEMEASMRNEERASAFLREARARSGT
ncbi:MAG: enoyl-CoA hydratase/isomerase family protein [Myxococcota bacterium]|nr:enoyl-CoA hydratase/isomerase family protein [Myxococcota bacterium]